MGLYEEYNRDYDNNIRSLDEERQKIREKFEKVKIFLAKLNIPFYDSKINIMDLYNILNDPEKAKEIFTKLNNKAFW